MTHFKKYGLPEWLVFLAGAAILLRAVYSMVIVNFKDTTWEEIALMILFLSIGIVALMAPLTLVDFARKKIGMETKK